MWPNCFGLVILVQTPQTLQTTTRVNYSMVTLTLFTVAVARISKSSVPEVSQVSACPYVSSYLDHRQKVCMYPEVSKG